VVSDITVDNHVVKMVLSNKLCDPN
jgi:hypothetical protein